MALTAKRIKKQTKPGRYRAGRGLYLQISPTGGRSPSVSIASPPRHSHCINAHVNSTTVQYLSIRGSGSIASNPVSIRRWPCIRRRDGRRHSNAC
jgi:hypothetical protein